MSTPSNPWNGKHCPGCKHAVAMDKSEGTTWFCQHPQANDLPTNVCSAVRLEGPCGRNGTLFEARE